MNNPPAINHPADNSLANLLYTIHYPAGPFPHPALLLADILLHPLKSTPLLVCFLFDALKPVEITHPLFHAFCFV